MNRRYVHRGRVIDGVYQRCDDDCPKDSCRLGHKWEYSIELPEIEGKRRRVYKSGFATGADAAEARAEVVNKERKGTQPRNHKLTVAEWLTDWLQRQEDLQSLGEGTVIDYRRHIDSYWIPAIGKLKLGDLRPHHVTDTLSSIRRNRDAVRAQAQAHNDAARAQAAEKDKERIAKGLKRPVRPKLVRVPRPFGNGTALRVLGTLRSALGAAVRAEEISRNVAAQAEKPRYRRKRVRPWQPEQLGAWLDSVAGDRLYPVFHLGAFAGLRRGELLGLGWDDIDLDKGVLVVRWQLTNVSYRKARLAIQRGERPVYRTKPKTRDGEERPVDLDPDTVEVLRRWRKQQLEEETAWGDEYDNPDRLVFTRENGWPYEPHHVYVGFVQSVKAMGYPPVPLHLLRHIAASLLIAAGVDIAVVSKRLGHSKIDLTSDTYGHLIGKVGKEAATKAAKLVPRGGDRQPSSDGGTGAVNAGKNHKKKNRKKKRDDDA